MWRSCIVCVALLMLSGCGGGGGTSPAPEPAVEITGIRPSQGLDANTPGYAGDILTIEALLEGGTPAVIMWDLGGGAQLLSAAASTEPRVQLGAPGMYRGRIAVTDAAGQEDVFEFDYTVRAEADRVQAITPAQPAGYVDQPVQFSVQADGEIELATWRFGSGAQPALVTGTTPMVQLTELGSHMVELQVTFKSGPTVRKSFPFTVANIPWTTLDESRDIDLIESLLLSDGSLAILQRKAGVDARLELLRIPAGAERDPWRWNRHEVGLPGVSNVADLEEHAGRLGILYVVQPGGTYGSRREAYFAASDSLSPTESADWQVSRVGQYVENFDVDLAGGSAQGWQALLRISRDVYWAATGSARPQSSDWVMGPFQSFAPGENPDVTLQRMSDALVAVVSSHTTTEVRVADAPDMTSLLAAPPYQLASHRLELAESGGRFLGLLDATHALVSPRTAPRQTEAWHVVSLEGTAARPDDFALAANDIHLFALVPVDVEFETFGVTSRELWSRPLGDLTSDWSREWLSARATNRAVLPARAEPLVAWHVQEGEFSVQQILIRTD